MGQYFEFVNLDKKEYIESFDFNNGMKEMEHSYLGNSYVRACVSLLNNRWKGDRVIHLGDYADELLDNKKFKPLLEQIIKEVGLKRNPKINSYNFFQLIDENNKLGFKKVNPKFIFDEKAQNPNTKNPVFTEYWKEYIKDQIDCSDLNLNKNQIEDLTKKTINNFSDKFFEELEKRIERLEKNLLDLKQDLSKEYGKNQPKYKVGDYVKFYFADKNIITKGSIIGIKDTHYRICVEKEPNFTFSYIVEEKCIIGFTKPDLLTSEEKEYLKYVLKMFDKSCFEGKVKIQKDDENRIWVSDDRKTIIQLFIPMFEFKGIKEMKMYYLEDL